MKIADLVTSKDGSLSLTKLAAATAHLNLAIAFSWLTYSTGYVADLWLIYGSMAIGHATVDKAMAVVNGFKTKQMEKAT